jgi:hypothetical protein
MDCCPASVTLERPGSNPDGKIPRTESLGGFGRRLGVRRRLLAFARAHATDLAEKSWQHSYGFVSYGFKRDEVTSLK